METKDIYREIINEHNLHPSHHGEISNPTYEMDGVNPSCGDKIKLQFKVDDSGIIEDAVFSGSGCAVSQASCDIMLDLVIGKSREESERITEAFMRMIKGEASDEELEILEEAEALADIAHMPARVKCAVLGWRTMEKIFKENRQ
ncbi:MAG: SUF system NifU family Fe-S cluster assembly protein [Clostridiales bacterium]|jgi:nitrogen fixation NifU-like protein|nr:SUF system NifU family Fe-S cluster assembly protein [Clostridiales bacterium]